MGIVQSLFGSTKLTLQPKGIAPFAQPEERDRQALFWWLKRNTSYTAIQDNAKLWAEFVAEWDKWLRSQEDPYEHLVTTLKYALDDQINYEHGLEILLRGDRSVFKRRSSDGWLAKINTGLVDRRMEWSGDPKIISQEDGVPLTVLLTYYKAHDSAMARGRSTSYRGMGFPKYSARTLYKALPFDTNLPEPRWEVSFAPGRRAPKDGIYEMVNQNGHIVGSLQHFIKAEEARAEDFVEFGVDAGNEDATAFIWRLIWEDTRYKDGKIPDEEKDYPTPEQSVALSKAPVESVQLRCEGDQPCPRAGYWFTPAGSDSRRHFEPGQLMPSMGGDYGITIWQMDLNQKP